MKLIKIIMRIEYDYRNLLEILDYKSSNITS